MYEVRAKMSIFFCKVGTKVDCAERAFILNSVIEQNLVGTNSRHDSNLPIVIPGLDQRSLQQ